MLVWLTNTVVFFSLISYLKVSLAVSFQKILEFSFISFEGDISGLLKHRPSKGQPCYTANMKLEETKFLHKVACRNGPSQLAGKNHFKFPRNLAKYLTTILNRSQFTLFYMITLM